MPSDGVVDALDALEDRGLIVRHPQSTVAGDVEYGFKHILIRDGAYGTMPRAGRRELHGAIARYLEDVLAARPDLGWLLAHHWTEAGVTRRERSPICWRPPSARRMPSRWTRHTTC